MRGHWRAPRIAAGPGLKAVELFRALSAGRIGAFWVMATNPAVSMPDGSSVRDALRRAPFLAVSDCVAETDTAGFAHVRLPAVGWAEKDGTVTNSERVITRQRAFLPPSGEARPDWWIVAQVAARLGWGDAFAWSGPAAIFREHAALTGLGNDGRRAFDISGLAGMTDAEYAAMPPTRWPCPAKGSPIAAERFFATGGFSAGRARFVPTPWRGEDAAAGGDDTLTLLTGRLRDQWHTMTRTGGVPRLMAHAPEPVLAVHPEDARGIADGALARIAGPHGGAVLRLRHDTGQRRGTAFAPMHWTAQNAPTARVNTTVPPAADPVSGQPALKSARVALAAYEPAWHGFLVARCDLGPNLAPYCATGLAGQGVWRHELAGTEEPKQAFARFLALFSAPGTAWARLEDPAGGLHRGVLLEGGRPVAALFLGPHHHLPPRDWLAALVAPDADDATPPIAALLAGRAMDGPPPSPTVCVCHGVSQACVLTAVENGAGNVAAVGEATKAGTGCGSCRPEIAALVAAVVEREAVPA